MPSASCVKSSLRQQMVLIRVLELRLQALCDRGELAADLHFCCGQEAIPVGVCAALGPNDLLLTHHRMIGWALCKGVPLQLLVDELLGKETGLCQGRAGEMHLRAPEYGFLHSFQLVGTVVPVAAGVAWAMKHVKKTGGIVVAVHGDAAMANGQWHEGLNIAAVNGLPLLLVCENNGVAGNVKQEQYLPPGPIAGRARAYGIPVKTVDGNSLDEIHYGATWHLDYIRHSSKPALLECVTARLGKHKQGMGDLRSKEEMAELALRDPLRDMTAQERAGAAAEVDRVLAVV